jgi:glucan phosphoethanolaminetransferase (alkaline phosphatase superfamily)
MNTKLVSIISIILLGISTLMAILFYAGGVNEEPIIMWCYALAIIAAAAAIIFPMFNIFTNPKGARSVLVGVAALAIVAGISYGVAGDEVLKSYHTYGTTPAESKLVSTGLILFYLLAGGAIIAAIYSEVSKIFK